MELRGYPDVLYDQLSNSGHVVASACTKITKIGRRALRVDRRPVISLAHQGVRSFLGGPKFYIGSMYENNGYAYHVNFVQRIFSVGAKFFLGGAKPPAPP